MKMMSENKKERSGETSPRLRVSASPCHSVAIYGGTFDPVHNGHFSIADGVSTLFDLDEVIFVPAFVAPHKRDVKSSAALHRYAMLALATQEEQKFRVSTIELDAPEKPFTIQTLSHFQKEWGESVRQFFIMGADSWADIKTWHDWENLLLMTDHIVVTRPGYELETDHVTQNVRKRIVDIRGMEQKDVHKLLEQEESEPKIFVTDIVEMNVSASQIRQDVRDGKEEWKENVPVSVIEYIEKYQLYKEL